MVKTQCSGVERTYRFVRGVDFATSQDCRIHETVSVPALGGLLTHSDEEILRSGERDQGVNGVVHLGYL